MVCGVGGEVYFVVRGQRWRTVDAYASHARVAAAAVGEEMRRLWTHRTWHLELEVVSAAMSGHLQ